MIALVVTALVSLSSGVTLDSDVADLAGHIEYWEDVDATRTIEEVRRDSFRSNFSASPDAVPNFGFTNSAFWFRIPVDNRSLISNWVVNVEYPLLDSVTLYVEKPGVDEVTSSMGGDRLPFDVRHRPHRTINFGLNFAPQTSATLWLRVQTESSMQLPIKVYSEAVFGDMSSRENLGYGLFSGFMILLALFAGLVALWLRDRSYVLFVAYLAAFVVGQALLSGVWFQWVMPNQPALVNRLLMVSILFGLYACLMLVEDFLDLANHHPDNSKVVRIFRAVALIMLVASLWLSYSITARIVAAFALIFVGLMLSSGVVSLKRGYKPARYFLLAWVVFLAGVFIFSLRTLGVLPANFFTINAMLLGALFQVIFLAVALGDKVLLIQAERDSATKSMLESYELLDVELHRREELQEENDSLQEEMDYATEQLIQAEKLSSLGQMVAGVAHDIASPTNFIGNARQQVRQDVDEVDSMLRDLVGEASSDEAIAVVKAFDERFVRQRRMLENVDKGLERIKGINEAIRNYSRTDREFQAGQCIKPLVDEAITILHSKLQEFELEIELEDLPGITCRRSQLGQVFANLLSNAADALGEQKAETNDGELFEGRIGIFGSPETREGINGIRLQFDDNGPGVPEEVREKILQAFYTTKEVGKGTGLGMSICDRIIKKHQGQLAIGASERLGGASMDIWLPIEQVLESTEESVA